MLIGSVFQMMYNMVDTIVVGRFVSVEALAAIGATSSATAFLLQVGSGLTNAVSVVLAQAEGAKQEESLAQGGGAFCIPHSGRRYLSGSALFLGRPSADDAAGNPRKHHRSIGDLSSDYRWPYFSPAGLQRGIRHFAALLEIPEPHFIF